jgi:hypothetical protein
MELAIPDVVRRKAMEGRADWLDTLPALVADLAELWGLTIGAAFDSGTEAFVAAVRDGPGCCTAMSTSRTRRGLPTGGSP